MVDAEHPRSPASLVTDLLGDFHLAGGCELRLKGLVELGLDLGISEPVMRVTLARLRERGWFEVRREGREAVYRLTPACVRALSEGGKRIFEPPGPWQGEWSMVIYTVPHSDRQTRDELRKKLASLGFGPLAPATWVCPHPRLDDLATSAAALTAARLTLLKTRTTGLPADREVAASCWQLDEVAAGYAEFVRWLRTRGSWLPSSRLGERTAFAERIRIANQYKQAMRHDPLLPAELQPAGWPGDEARRLFRQSYDRLAGLSAEVYSGLAV
jgi:phenylacetic acid degradation operon negative regulatory protein